MTPEEIWFVEIYQNLSSNHMYSSIGAPGKNCPLAVETMSRPFRVSARTTGDFEHPPNA